LYRVLIVDDEDLIVQGVRSCVDWGLLEVADIHEAFDAREAKQILLQEQVDLMICDIEMPGENGLQLLEWCRKQSPHTQVILLTCHAEFTYAQKAVELGSFQYLLKPVSFGQLEEVAGAALDLIRSSREKEYLSDAYQKYYVLWEKKKSRLAEWFWQDLLSRRTPPNVEQIEMSAAEFQLSLPKELRVTPVLISMEEWQQQFHDRDEQILEYAIGNAATELMLAKGDGILVQDRRGAYFMLIYRDADVDTHPMTSQQLKQRCEQWLEACCEYFYCHVSCYVGPESCLTEIAASCNALLDMERNNVRQANAVMLYRPNLEPPSYLKLPSFFEWSDLLEQGKKEALDFWLEDTFNDLQKETGLKPEALQSFYHGFFQMVLYVLQKQGIPLDTVQADPANQNFRSATRSIVHLKDWVQQLSRTAVDQIQAKRENVSVIAQIKQYIQERLLTEITREELASHVYLNPAYLSRLFKKETNDTITDFIVRERMKLAAKHLKDSDEPVSSIAQTFGYSNFSHFSRMFKKCHGMTPQEYRKE